MTTLSKKLIYDILDKRILFKTKEELIYYLKLTKDRFFKYSINSKNELGNDKYINPLQWQLGHITFFYSNLVLKNLKNCKNIDYIENYNNLVNFYDSFKTPIDYRNSNSNKYLLLSSEEIYKLYDEIIHILIDYIKSQFISNVESYLIFIGILHNEMHNEAFIFSKLSLTNFINFEITICNEELIENINFINYDGGNFKQGIDDNCKFLIFDNERPSFDKKINKFQISKYKITEYQFIQFIKDGGYKKKNLWCINGWLWKEKNNINLPLYWNYKNDHYYKLINNQLISVYTNLPIVNISYYEAKAFCNWSGGRLPLEEEYEYSATNEGTTFFPWGNDFEKIKKCNLNYKTYIKSVKFGNECNNKKGMSQLIGNVWEWCEESIYPYDGFKIDPVYREMSYPFFGFKKICKGGCFAVPDFLIHPKYRNAQYPDCRIQFIGFRICKDV